MLIGFFKTIFSETTLSFTLDVTIYTKKNVGGFISLSFFVLRLWLVMDPFINGLFFYFIHSVDTKWNFFQELLCETFEFCRKVKWKASREKSEIGGTPPSAVKYLTGGTSKIHNKYYPRTIANKYYRRSANYDRVNVA